MTQEKRRIQRFSLDTPIAAKMSGLAVSLLDLSTAGARIEHSFPLQGGRRSYLEFPWGDEGIQVQCEVVRCRLQKSVRQPGAIIYSSGLRFSDPAEESRETIRRMVAELVKERA